MIALQPFQFTKIAPNGVATKLSATDRPIVSALITAKAGNAGAVLIGTLDDATGLPDPKTAVPLELPIVTAQHEYNLQKYYILTTNDADGVEVFGHEL